MRRLVIAVLAALAIPSVAHARTDDFAKPVLFVTGPEQADCSAFDRAFSVFPEYTTTIDGKRIGLSGDLVSVGLYASTSGCVETLDASRDATVEQLGDAFARFVETRYTGKGKAVDVVGYGGGGLVVRAALDRHSGLRIEDAVTVGTPHGGSATLADLCGTKASCAQLRPGSALLKGLDGDPQGTGGTDWSAIGSESDLAVGGDSAVAMQAAHKTMYRFAGPSHAELMTDGSPKQDAKIRHSHDQGKWVEWNQAPHPLERIAENLVYGVNPEELTCGLQATNPDLCGKTPVILVPGFGASQLECHDGNDIENAWPAAAGKPWWYTTMALNDKGNGPADPSDECAASLGPNGHVLYDVAGNNIHGESWKWLQSIAPGRAYEFGWDFRKGPEETLDRLDRFVDEVRAKHGVSRVALVAHSYGGLLSRWYIDDARRANKVRRVANFGSPWWGAPKAWFAMAYGYETPAFSPLDIPVPRSTFKNFAMNLAGLYYLIPPAAWAAHVPEPLKSWLELDESAQDTPDEVFDAIRRFKGNPKMARDIAANHFEHIDGFKTANGVDWRIFIGSGLPTLGHVRAFTDSDYVQYSWINGDGTVPLFSQRQSMTAGGEQMGDQVPTYNFCGVAHMVEMETPALQVAATGFIADGTDPVVDDGTLKRKPCDLSATKFRVTHDEDAKSVKISSDATALPSRLARAAQAPSGEKTLAQAEAAGLVEVMDDAHQTVFVTNRGVTVHATGSGPLEVTPLTGDAKEGKAKVYDLSSTPLDITAKGASAQAYRSGAPVSGRAADRTPPRTTAKRRGGKLTLQARDASGVAVTMVKVGKAKAKPYRKALKVRGGTTVRYWSIDTFGNVEKRRISRAG